MGIADLTESIIANAHDQADKVLADADEEVRKIEKETKELVEKEITRREKLLQQERDLQERKMEAETHLLEAQERLVCKQEQINLAFEEAWAKISKMSAKERSTYLTRKKQEVQEMLGKNASIFCAKPDIQAMKKISPVKGTIDASGGFIAKSQNGRVEIDCTFERRLEEIRQKITPEIATFLFNEKNEQRKNLPTKKRQGGKK